MPVSASVPCRLRLDARSVTEQADEVEAALADALDRALARSQREVVEPRGGYLAVRPQEPTFRWSGLGLDGVPAEARRALEARLRQVVQDAVTRAALDPAPARDTPTPLPPGPSERLDPERWGPILGTYQVPTYRKSPKKATVRAHKGRRDEPEIRHEWALKRLADLQAHLPEIAREAVRKYGPLPSGNRGLIAHIREPHGKVVWLVLVNTNPLSWFTFDSFGQSLFHRVHGKAGAVVESTKPPEAGPGTVERHLVNDRLGLVALTTEVLRDGLAAQIMVAEPPAEGQSPDEYKELLDKEVEAVCADLVDAQLARLRGQKYSSVLVLRVGAASPQLLIVPDTTDAQVNWVGTANLLPVTVEPRHGGGEEGGGRKGREGAGREGARAGGGGEVEARGTGGEGGGTGTGVGTGEGAGQPSPPPPPGGFVFDPSAPRVKAEGEAGRFPVLHLFPAEAEACVPFNGEPPLDALGQAGQPLRRMIDEIAFRLQMGKPCYFPARFCLMAAHVIQGRAHDISTYISVTERPAFTQPVPEGTGNLGPITFRAVASPAVQFLRHLAGVVPRLHHLALSVMRLYEAPEHWPKVQGGWIDSPASWNLHFLEEFTPAGKDAVGEIYRTACQAVLLQLLLGSKQGIDARIANFTKYAPIFERLMVSQLSDYAELQGLRQRLQLHAATKLSGMPTQVVGGELATAAAPTDPAAAWRGAARGLSGVFATTGQALTTMGEAGQIVEQGGLTRIRDSHGVLWSESDIEQALVMQRGTAEGIDPLVKQISDVPDVLIRFKRDRSAIRDELWRVLHEMQSNNTEMIGKARDSAWWAFRASRISDNIPAATVPGSRYALQGIHLQVHLQIGAFFGGDVFYALGIDALFNAELGRQELSSFGLNLGIVLLCVLCPPAGFLVGVAVAVGEVVHVRERARLYGSMLDPELVLTKAEVEVELFAAYLGLALSLLPEVGTAAGAVAHGGKVALRAGLRAGVRSAGRYVARRVARQVVEAAARDLLQAFITEILVNEVMSRVIEKVLEPVLAHIEREAILTGAVGGPEGARFALMVLGEERAATLAAKPAGAAP
jgi:hypothetical protein